MYVRENDSRPLSFVSTPFFRLSADVFFHGAEGDVEPNRDVSVAELVRAMHQEGRPAFRRQFGNGVLLDSPFLLGPLFAVRRRGRGDQVGRRG